MQEVLWGIRHFPEGDSSTGSESAQLHKQAGGLWLQITQSVSFSSSNQNIFISLISS